MKQKLQELLDKYDLNEYKLTRYTGAGARTNTLVHILNGEQEVTSTNLNLLTTFARGLGVQLEDILDDFELDGSASQVLNIERKVERIRKITGEVDEELAGGGFVKGVNIKKNIKISPKKKYEFLNPKVNHNSQPVNDIYLLNSTFLNRDFDEKENRNKSLIKIDRRYNSYAWSYFIYSPLKDGGDIKVAVSVFDKKGEGNLVFTEVYGCEWISRSDNKSICYYKYRTEDDVLSNKVINNSQKEEISELEFYRGFLSQFLKFKLDPK